MYENDIAYQCHFGVVAGPLLGGIDQHRIFMDFYATHDAFAFKMRWI
jgi:hypothetical protein